MSAADPSVLASDPAVSAWVDANAGAGKTHTLANRVTRLLLAGAKPERILCLTFTKAAAAEMQGRLFDQLGNWAMLPDSKLREKLADIGATADTSLAVARRLFAQALETPGGLKVLTIHAFCQIVLSRFPIEAGIAPGFEVMDEQSARAAIADARQAVLERAGSGDAHLAAAVALLVTETSEARLHDTLQAALTGDRRKMDRFFAGLGDTPLGTAVARAHGAREGETPESIARDFCAGLRREINRLRDVAAWLGSETLSSLIARNFDNGFEVMGDMLLTKDGEPRKKLAVKKLAEARPDLLAWLTDLQTAFCGLEERRRAARAAALAQAALTVIGAVRQTYAAVKERRAVLDYDDLIEKTLELLDRREAAQWVLYKLDNGIDHVLIDEAQDTSPEQWAIVRKLTEEFFADDQRPASHSDAQQTMHRTLFAVGDEKQSIFSFQGADPAQFDINRSHFRALAVAAEREFLDQPLILSRRSAPEILGFVDRVFASETARAGLTSRNLAITHEAHRKDAKGSVEFWTALPVPQKPEIDHWRPVDVEQPSSPVTALAARIAIAIEGWIRGRVTLPGHAHAIRPGDIMILLPRREPFGSEVIRQLKLRDIAVAGADRIILTEQIAVMDLIALGRFVLQREDDLNLAALLRSPLCGVDEGGLYDLCHGRESSVWQSLLTHQAGRPEFSAAHAFLADMLARADYAPPFEFYSHALTALGRKAALVARLGPESSDAIDEFLTLALAHERGATPSLEGFIDQLERGGNQIKRDMERGRDEVRVMTVHGAKGLEADIVILPDTTSLPDPPSRKGHMLFADDGVLFALSEAEAPQQVKLAKQAEMAETLKEHRRLLYVALTRARDRLYVCGFENAKGVREGSWYRLAEEAANALGRALTRGEDEIRIYGDDADTRSEALPDTTPPPASLPSWMTRPAPRPDAAPRFIRPSDGFDMPEPAMLSPLGDGAARFQRGLMVHALLARLPDVVPERRADVARSYLARQGLAPAAADALVEETLAVLDDPRFAAAFGPGSRAEVPFLAALPEFGDKAQVTGRIDRLAVQGDEVLILDFKTNRPPALREEEVDGTYLAQMALYRAAARAIFPGKRIVCGLLWTDGPRLLTLSDAILDAQMGQIRRRLDPEGAHS